MNWDDLRIFLAVAELGSLRRAAEMLGVSQPTVGRRLRALEADLGQPLFDRDRDGHRPTPAAEALLPQARAVETAARRVESSARTLVGGLSETVRVAAGEWAARVLSRGLSALADGPRVELLVTGLSAAPAGRMPEILVRHGLPDTGDGVTRRVGELRCALYGAKRFAEGRVLPLTPAEVATLPWLGFVAEQQHYVTMRWLEETMRGRPPAARLMRTDLMLDAAQDGLGTAVLPCFLGDTAPGLVRLSAPIDALRADYWTVLHPDLARNPSVRAVADWVLSCFQTIEQSGGRP